MGFHLCGVSFTLGSGLSEIYLSEPWSNRYYFFGYYSSQVARMDMKIFQVLQEVFEHFEDDHSDEAIMVTLPHPKEELPDLIRFCSVYQVMLYKCSDKHYTITDQLTSECLYWGADHEDSCLAPVDRILIPESFDG